MECVGSDSWEWYLETIILKQVSKKCNMRNTHNT